jgi:3',5'-cyclic AMP phosphodiesterase CpdA
MTREASFLLVQVSDPHLDAHDEEPYASLCTAVAAIRDLPDRPDAVVVTGDLVESGGAPEYRRLAGTLAEIGAPVFVVNGNCDDAAALSECFEISAPPRRVRYGADLGPLRLLVLDSTVRGELTAEDLSWLEPELAAFPGTPTVVAMHHPPLATLVPAWDDLGLARSSVDALGEVVRAAPHVLRIVAGHFHHAIVGQLAGVPVCTVPSTSANGQLRLSFERRPIGYEHGPAFAVHAFADGELGSHVQPVAAAR